MHTRNQAACSSKQASNQYLATTQVYLETISETCPTLRGGLVRAISNDVNLSVYMMYILVTFYLLVTMFSSLKGHNIEIVHATLFHHVSADTWFQQRNYMQSKAAIFRTAGDINV